MEFSDGSTSGSGGAISLAKMMPFTKESAEKIMKSSKFKSGKHSVVAFIKACASLGLKLV